MKTETASRTTSKTLENARDGLSLLPFPSEFKEALRESYVGAFGSVGDAEPAPHALDYTVRAPKVLYQRAAKRLRRAADVVGALMPTESTLKRSLSLAFAHAHLGRPLLTVDNPKVLKTARICESDLRALAEVGRFIDPKRSPTDWSAVALHLAPSLSSGVNTCPAASPECIRLCLNTAGRAGMAIDARGENQFLRARLARTAFAMFAPWEFFAILLGELRNVLERARAERRGVGVRLNATSDLALDTCRSAVYLRERIQEEFGPFVHFYDYTKRPTEAAKGAFATFPPPANGGLWGTDRDGVYRIFSVDERPHSWRRAEVLLNLGVSVVVVVADDWVKNSAWTGEVRFFHRAEKDLSLSGYVVDGDLHDCRFLDLPDVRRGRGCIVTVRAKGRAKKENGFSPFVVQDSTLEGY